MRSSMPVKAALWPGVSRLVTAGVLLVLALRSRSATLQLSLSIAQDLARHLHVEEGMVDLPNGLSDLLRREGVSQRQGHEDHLHGQQPHGVPPDLYIYPVALELHVLETAGRPILQEVREDVLQQELLVDHDDQDQFDGHELPGGLPADQQIVARLVGYEKTPEADYVRCHDDVLHDLQSLTEDASLNGADDEEAQDANHGSQHHVLPHHPEDGGKLPHRQVVHRQAWPETATGRRAPVLPRALPRQGMSHGLDFGVFLHVPRSHVAGRTLVP
mmetsp:Transcript_33314/g.99215  ORF Transcript_33314/g.99215 Transcript_33314/m.99215 type:complete len:273 (+) Transcript_33314:162-980(+)